MSFGCVTANFCRTLVPFTVMSPTLLRRRKFHSTLRHWIACIEELGAPYWYSGEANEEYHKIAAKAHTCQMSVGCLLDTNHFLQWAYKQTNKRDAEDQMVRHIEEYDGIAAMAQAVPELMLSSSKFAPSRPVRPNLDFPGAFSVVPSTTVIAGQFT